jgi:nickel/cobalt transporter (NicO) family protein
MSVTAEPLSAPPALRTRTGRRIVVLLAAVAAVALAAGLLAWLISPGSAPPPARAPFGLGVREAAPARDGLGAYLLAVQGSFYRSLQMAVTAVKESGGALWTLLGIGFAYGVFHAAGPGHGKAVISAYLVSDGRGLLKGFGLSLAAALVQALVAIALVSVVAVLLKATAATVGRLTHWVELASFACVGAMGAAIAWRKAGRLLGILTLAHNPMAGPQDESCDHVHLPPPEVLDRARHWREMAGVVLAAGLRPCAGALVVLVFALSQGLFAAGVGATVAMALGTALTTGLIATLAVFAKTLALRVAGGRGAAGSIVVASIELLAAAFVLVLGASLLFGLWSSAAAS